MVKYRIPIQILNFNYPTFRAPMNEIFKTHTAL